MIGLSRLLAMQGDVSAATLPNAAPLTGMEKARSYAIVNQSNKVIVAAHARMTNGDVRDLTAGEPLRPGLGGDIAVPSDDCLQSLTVSLKSGPTLQLNNPPDCKVTRFIVTDTGIQPSTSASNRPPVQ